MRGLGSRVLLPETYSVRYGKVNIDMEKDAGRIMECGIFVIETVE